MIRTLLLGSAALTATALAGQASSPRPTAEVFAGISPQYGEFTKFGYIAELDIHYAMTCEGGWNDEVMFLRDRAGGPQTWSAGVNCERGVSLRDLDADGTPEIRYYTAGGGTGTFAVTERYVSWPSDAEQPEKAFTYPILRHEESIWWGPNDEESYYMIYDGVAELPEGAVCDSLTDCPVISETIVCFSSCDTPPPQELVNSPEWPAIVQHFYDRNNAILSNAGVATTLSEIELAPLEGGGDAPQITAERRAEFEDFLERD